MWSTLLRTRVRLSPSRCISLSLFLFSLSTPPPPSPSLDLYPPTRPLSHLSPPTPLLAFASHRNPTICSPLPVEIIQYANDHIRLQLEALEALRGCEARLRLKKDGGEGPYVTDNGNYIVDLHFP